MDGLMRVSRFAEDYYHMVENNESPNFSAALAKDVTHGGWLKTQPMWITDHDLPRVLTPEAEQTALANQINAFLSGAKL